MGLSATEIAPSLQDFLARQNIHGDDPKKILAAISLLSLQDRGYYRFKRATRKPHLSPITEDKEPISQQQNSLLSQILNKDFQWAMYEFITKVKAQNLLIPAFRIPELIEYALSETWLKPWIEALTGIRGAWALSHIPNWEKKYHEIPSGHWQKPLSVEKKIFPLLNLKSPIQNLGHILDELSFPALIWSPKLSQRMFEYIQVSLKMPNMDIRVQEDLEDLIYFASYMTCLSIQLSFEVDNYDKNWTTALMNYNQVRAFRKEL